MRTPRWVLESNDEIVKFLRDNKIPVTRANYIGLNWLGDYDPSEPLPAELEMDLPEELQFQEKGTTK